jgi:3-phenylpropionate/trans-cinnamate dioxygenase ferredoxin reductase subunit
MNPDSPQAARRIIVVGAGHAGGAVAAVLRQYGFAGSISLISEESVAPYHRPPLSKAWLKGAVTLDSLALKADAFYHEQNIDLRLGERVETIDPDARQITLGNAQRMTYDTLILATGATARTLPIAGAQHANVITLRSQADAGKLRGTLGPGKRLLIIGGGYVGLECAATARALGAEVVVLEKAPRLLERVASAPIASFLQAHHEKNGVTFALNADIEAIEGTTSADAVRLADGRYFPCDALLIGVGAAPASALAQAAGLACDDGITVDADCRTVDPHIFAIGDVAKRPHPLYQRNLRLESVPNTMEQAKRVAAVITGRAPAAAEVPWFWSEQYALKLQIVGLPFDSTEIIVRGMPESGQFAVFHLRDNHLITVEAINSPTDFFAGKKLINSGNAVSAARIADTSCSLNELTV